MIELYDLAAADDTVRMSPYCWRTRLALEHKQLPYRTVPWRFVDKDVIAFSGQGACPVITDGDKHVHDSWAIMEYLEAAYPERPKLFDSPQAKAEALFIKAWTEQVLHPGLTKQVILELYAMLDERDKPHFRTTREARFGMTLEAFAQDADEALPGLRKSMTPLRAALAQQKWLGGASPNYADYIVFGGFQWARTSSAKDVLEADDLIGEWRGRMLGLFNGLGAGVPARRAS